MMRVDLDKLAANVRSMEELLRRDPTAGHVTPIVRTHLVSNVHARSDFVQYGKNFSFECDESEGRGGGDEHPSPLRYFLSGLAFCQQVWYAKGAALAGCQIEELEIDIRTYMDMRGEHRIDDIAPHPQWVVIEARVSSPSDSATVLAMVDEAHARCPVYNLVIRAIPIYERIEHNGTVVRFTVPDDLERDE